MPVYRAQQVGWCVIGVCSCLCENVQHCILISSIIANVHVSVLLLSRWTILSLNSSQYSTHCSYRCHSVMNVERLLYIGVGVFRDCESNRFSSPVHLATAYIWAFFQCFLNSRQICALQKIYMSQNLVPQKMMLCLRKCVCVIDNEFFIYIIVVSYSTTIVLRYN